MSRKVRFGIIFSLSLIVMTVFTKPWTVDWTTSESIRYYVLSLAGFLGMIVMMWQALLGIRPMFAWWSRDFFWINGWHKWLGIGTIAMILIHPIAVVVAYGTSGLYAIVPDFSSSFETWVSIGKIAFDLIMAVLITSILSRRIVSFRVWRWVHLLVYPAFVMVWLHALQSGFMLSTNSLVYGYWIVIGVVLGVSMIVRLAYQFGWLKQKATILSHTLQTDDVYELTLQLTRAIDYTAGQFMYMQYPRGGESHPFTVLSYDNETQVMRVAYKAQGKRTKSVARLVGTSGQFLYLDGPYGRFTSDIITSDRPVVCIAAGIGITPFYELAEQYAGSRDIKLLYLNRTGDDTPYKSDFDTLMGNDVIHILSRQGEQTQENEIVGTRLTSDILREQVGEWLPRAQFYICGSGGVIASVREMLTGLGVQQSHIDFEPFDM